MKHRSIIYVVLRTQENRYPVILDSFYSNEEAENRRGAYEQEFLDHGIEGYSFSVQSSCFYDM